MLLPTQQRTPFFYAMAGDGMNQAIHPRMPCRTRQPWRVSNQAAIPDYTPLFPKTKDNSHRSLSTLEVVQH